MSKVATLCLGLAFLAALPMARADSQAVALGSYYNYTNGAWTLGFAFSPIANINVTSLGSYFPANATDIHGVSIWDTVGTVLATIKVTGTGTEGFDFTSIAPLGLTAGTEYIVGANTLADPYAVLESLPTYAPGINFLGHTELRCSGVTPCYPGLPLINSDADYGANFTFTAGAAPIPEPGSIVLLLTAIIGVGLVFRNKAASLS